MKKLGRPQIKFKPEWCEMLIKHCAQGLSIECFAAEIDTTTPTLYQLFDRYPEFLNAKKKAEAKCRSFWEKMGVAGAAGKLKNFQTGAWIFNMKNRFGWRDVQDINANIQGAKILIIDNAK